MIALITSSSPALILRKYAPAATRCPRASVASQVAMSVAYPSPRPSPTPSGRTRWVVGWAGSMAPDARMTAAKLTMARMLLLLSDYDESPKSLLLPILQPEEVGTCGNMATDHVRGIPCERPYGLTMAGQ